MANTRWRSCLFCLTRHHSPGLCDLLPRLPAPLFHDYLDEARLRKEYRVHDYPICIHRLPSTLPMQHSKLMARRPIMVSTYLSSRTFAFIIFLPRGESTFALLEEPRSSNAKTPKTAPIPTCADRF